MCIQNIPIDNVLNKDKNGVISIDMSVPTVEELLKLLNFFSKLEILCETEFISVIDGYRIKSDNLGCKEIALIVENILPIKK